MRVFFTIRKNNSNGVCGGPPKPVPIHRCIILLLMLPYQKEVMNR